MKTVVMFVVGWGLLALLPILIVWGITSFAYLSIIPMLDWHPMTRGIAAIWVTGMTLSFVGFLAGNHYN